MSDIVERLRKYPKPERCNNILRKTSENAHDAADEIERLRAALREIVAMDEVAIVDFKKGDGWLHQRVARAALEKEERT